ncbi:MAG: carboxypeptidase-like regulatory domain-containing protein [Cyclobacteriaceae bacterium]
MKSGFTLSVPNPCSEDWNSFTPTETGGFCSRCQKNVIDFTKSTDDEIIAFISKKSEHTCGRFKSSQLKTYAILPTEKVRPGFMLFKAGIASLLLLLVSKPTSAQVSMPRPSIEARQNIETTKPITHSEKNVVRGKVTSEQDGSVLPGVSVVQKGTANGVQTDQDGLFELTLQPSDELILTFAFIGLVTEEVKLKSPIPATINVKMSEDVTGFVGELVIVGAGHTDSLYSEKRHPLKRFWNKITKWF